MKSWLREDGSTVEQVGMLDQEQSPAATGGPPVAVPLRVFGPFESR